MLEKSIIEAHIQYIGKMPFDYIGVDKVVELLVREFSPKKIIIFG